MFWLQLLPTHQPFRRGPSAHGERTQQQPFIRPTATSVQQRTCIQIYAPNVR